MAFGHDTFMQADRKDAHSCPEHVGEAQQVALMSLVSHVPIGCSNQVSRVRSAVKELAASEARGWRPPAF